MLVIYELSSDVAPMSNYLSGELHRAPKLGGLGFDLLFRFLFLSHAGGKTYAVKILSAWNEKDASLRPTSKILLRNLTITDLCAGLISQPLAMTVFLSLITENWTFCRKAKYSAYIVTTIFSGVSLATLTSIAVERLLALFLGIRYGQVEIVRRTLTVVLFI